MKKSKYISLIFILGFLIACQNLIDPVSLEFEKKMVLHCLFQPAEHWQLKLESNMNVANPDDTTVFIEGADILLKDSKGHLLGPFEYRGEGIYEIPYEYPETGEEYSIEIRHSDYPALYAKSKVPDLFEIEDLMEQAFDCKEQVCKAYSLSYESFSTIASKVILTNQLTRLYLNSESDTITVEEMDLLLHHPASNFADEFLEENLYGTTLFFDGLTHHAELLFLTLNGFRKENEVSLVKGVAHVELRRCSEAYYQYRRSQEIYEKSKTKFVSSLLAPVEIFSNIDGGLGIFAASHRVGVEYDF